MWRKGKLLPNCKGTFSSSPLIIFYSFGTNYENKTTIGITYQRNKTITIRVIFNGFYFTFNTITFITFKINNSVKSLVLTSLVSHSNSPLVITSGMLFYYFQ